MHKLNRWYGSAQCCALSLALAVVAGYVSAAPFAYISNSGSNTVSVIDIATDTVVGLPIPVGAQPYGVAANTQGTRVYVTNSGSDSVSVIATATNSVVATISVGTQPRGIAVNATGTRVYVANRGSDTVSVIDAATNAVVATIPVTTPLAIAVDPARARVYVAAETTGSVLSIDTTTYTLGGLAADPCFDPDEGFPHARPAGIAVNATGTRVFIDFECYGVYGFPGLLGVADPARPYPDKLIAFLHHSGHAAYGLAVSPAGNMLFLGEPGALLRLDMNAVAGSETYISASTPRATVGGGGGVAVDPSGSRVYVVNNSTNTVSVIDEATMQVMGSPIPVGSAPTAFGQFISPGPPPPTIWWRDTSGGSVASWQFASADSNEIVASFFPAVPTNWEAKFVADVDGDGVPDIVWFDANTGQVAIWLMQSPTQIKSVTFPASVGVSDWQLDAVGDVNGDGHADLAWRNSSSGQLLVWYMSAEGSISSTRDYGNVPLSFELRGAGDMNGDGIADLVWFEPSDGVVAVWMMHADGGSSATFPAAVGAGNWRPHKLADLDGDGKADMLWRNEADGSVAAWYMDSGVLSDFDFFVSVGSDWTLGSASDFNGDGRADLLWYPTAAGDPVRWMMKGRHVPVVTESLSGIAAGWMCFQ